MISCSAVSKRYPGGLTALENVNCEIGAGEMVFITGHSGAGKSTLVKLIAAIERPTGGGIVVNGQNLSALRASALPYLRRNFGLVFQDQKLLFDRSVIDNVLLPLAIIGTPAHDAMRRAQAALDKVGLLERAKANPIALSGGEQQRVAIARAFVNKPQILIADEPTGNLDPTTSVGIMRLLDRINRTGTTVIMATHDAAIVDQMRKRVIELDEGRLMRDHVRGVYGSYR